MRRLATMVLAAVFPLALSLAASAQPKPAADGGAPAAATGKPAADAGAPQAATSSTTTGATSASDAAAPIAAPSATAAASTDKGTGMDGATYAVRLRDLEQRVDELKDQIRRSHARLALLSDTIIGGGMAGSRSEINFEDEMSSAFRLTRALFVLDGAVQYNRQDDSGALADQKTIPIFSGSVPPGDHTISVVLNFQGNGYGVFTYLRGYKFEVKSSHSFTAVEGKTLSITATALEKGGVTTPLEQRPTIEWHEKVQPLGGGGAAAGPATPAPAATGSISGSVQIGGGNK
jgi:hypothetical protein